MTSAIARDWIEAAKVFAIDANADVACPVCQNGKLQSEDIPLPGNEVIERQLSCNVCGSQNLMRLGVPTLDQ